MPNLERRATQSPAMFFGFPEPYGRRRLYGTRNVTVACDGGAGAQAGVLLETGDVPPNRAPGYTHRGLSFASHGPCSSLLLI